MTLVVPRLSPWPIVDAGWAGALSGEVQRGQTRDGWDLERIVTPTAQAWRYRFAEWCGLVRVEGAFSAELEQILVAASPDWRGDGEIVCLADLE